MTTQQAKHTPGPWHVRYRQKRSDFDGGMPEIVGDENGLPVIADIRWNGENEEYGQANARLIAAAPELLEACKRAYAELDDRYDVDRPVGESPKEYPFGGAGELMRILRVAIAKAEGETQ